MKKQVMQMPKKIKFALKFGIQAYQILTNDDEVYIPSLSSMNSLSCTSGLLYS